MRNNGVPNRLCKVPYSLIEDRIALPLEDEQIENFKVEDMKIDKILYNNKIRLFRRGLKERFNNLSIIDKVNNVNQFIESINFKENGT